MTESEVQTVSAGPAPDDVSHTVNMNSAALNLEDLQIGYTAAGLDDVEYPANIANSDSDDEEDPDPIMAFAMLKFTDGKYFMKTMSLLIGRDMVAYRAALLDSNAWALRHGTTGQQDTFIYEVLHQQESREPGSKGSSAGASPNANGSNEAESLSGADNGALKDAPEDASTDECPFLAIHQPKEFGDPLPSGSSISRRHAKIVFNTGTGHFEIFVLGKNGLFVNQEYLPMGERVQLNHRDHVQIAAIEFDFFLPSGGDADDEDAGPDSVSGRMSFAFEDASGEQVDVAVGSEEETGWNGHSAKYSHNVYYESYSSSEGDSEEEDSGEMQDDEEDDDDDDGDVDAEGGDPDEMEQDGLDVDDEDEEEVDSDEPEPEPKATARIKITLRKGHKTKAGRIKPAKKSAFSKMKPTTGGKRPLKTNAKNDKLHSKSNSTKLKGKAPAKDVGTEDNDDKDDKKDETPVARIARDEPLQNGDGVEIIGLPIGVTIPARRKGPGRPPKDGIMSKRERQLLIRQWREQEKAKKLGLDPSTIIIPEPKKTGRPRKNSKGEDLLDDGENGMKDGDDLERKKVIRQPRSPSPQMKEEDYNEEQLARPSGNYVIFIYEAIMASAEKKLNLQQIYSAIERKYPYFKFRVSTPGWQSSVRHNLGQHPAFEKVEKDGKGYLWGIKDGVPIDRERKKRSPPPPNHPYSYPAPPYPSMPNGAIPPHYGMHTQQNPPPRQPLVPPSLAHSAATTRPTSYSSPYATANHRPATTHTPHPTYTQPSQDQSSSTSTQKPHSYQQTTYYPPVQRPSQDVIETFVSVFKKSFQDNRKAIDMAAADRIVNNAVKRVLEPHTMVNVPPEDSEQSVVDAFRRCLERSQGPPRQALPATTPLVQMGTATSRSTPPGGLGILTDTLVGASIPRSTTPPDPVQSTTSAPTTAATASSSSAPPKANELHTLLAEQLSSANGRSSPQRPAVEPLTPPAGPARTTPLTIPKRTIDEVEQPEVSASKKLEVERVSVEA